ncbi:MAG TPA: nuclear transport factor 2 family protein [Acidimicrobiales bacterium]|jgi:hypothetical protein|nr:nuclear transport factor 2 family protein [Acidimicrobiales bacterium]
MEWTADTIAERVWLALDAADLDEFAQLLDPDVTWGPPGGQDTCRNKEQVLSWYQKGRAAGTRATVSAMEVHGDQLLVGLAVSGGSDPERWQILVVGPGGVTDIRGFEDRQTAFARLRL